MNRKRRVTIWTLVMSLAIVMVIPLLFTSSHAATSSHAVAGWIVGNSIDGYDTILHTTDGGDTWERQGSTDEVPNVHLLSVSAIDSNTAWVIGGDLTILHTEDGGSTWENQTPEGTVGLCGISFITR